MENYERKLLKLEKKLTNFNVKEANLDRKYDQLCQAKLCGQRSILNGMKKKIITLKTEKIESLKEDAQKVGLFETMERLIEEGFEYSIHTLIIEFKKGLYSKQSVSSQSVPDVSLLSSETIAKKIKDMRYDFYGSLDDSFVTEEIKRISKEKELGEWHQYFPKFRTEGVYYNYLDGSSTFALKPEKTCYDNYRYLWLHLLCCASHIVGSDLSYSNQLFLNTVPAFLNLLFVDSLTGEIDHFSKNSDNYMAMNYEIETFKTKYHESIISNVSLCSFYQECFYEEVYRAFGNLSVTKYYRICLATEWIKLFTKFLGYSLYKVWQEDSALAFQMLDEYMKNFSKFSQTLDLSLIGLSDEDVLKYTRDFGKYGK